LYYIQNSFIYGPTFINKLLDKQQQKQHEYVFVSNVENCIYVEKQSLGTKSKKEHTGHNPGNNLQPLKMETTWKNELRGTKG